MSHLSVLGPLAAGGRALPAPPSSLAAAFAATQGAYRFYANENITLPQLAGPLTQAAKTQIPHACNDFVLVALDWSNLPFSHANKTDRIAIGPHANQGYELLTALALGDIDGTPLAPVALDLRCAQGLCSTRSNEVLPAPSQLDALPAMLGHIGGLELGKTPVYLIDRAGDSIAHHRQFARANQHFVIRANDAPNVRWEQGKRSLMQVAQTLVERGLAPARTVLYKGKEAFQHIGATSVTITRPARTNRVGTDGTKRHRNVAGEPLTLRLIVSEVRDAKGKRLARWLLLSNLTAEQATPQQIALWYYWRWRIESFHKLIKGPGLQIEQWQQESAPALARRLLVGAMALTCVWQLARDERPEATAFKQVLVNLSGRQMKRGPTQPGFTIPALLAGLGVLIPMLLLLETHRVKDLKTMLRAALPLEIFKPPGLV